MESFEQLEKQLYDSVSKSLNDKYGSDIEELQRTEDWFKSRTGVFTGSGIKDLMTCSQSTAKMPWGTDQKIIGLGETAKAYIYEKAMERKHNRYIQSADLFQFKYGKKVEQPIREMLLEQKPYLKSIPQGFKKVNNYLGASPDDLLLDTENGVNIGGEYKGAMGFNGMYKRCAMPFDQSHIDFWQVQSEMLVLNVDSLFYVTGAPVASPADVVYGDMSNEEIKDAIGTIDVQLINASDVHQKAILDRARLGNDIIEMFLSGVKFHESVVECCTNFKF